MRLERAVRIVTVYHGPEHVQQTLHGLVLRRRHVFDDRDNEGIYVLSVAHLLENGLHRGNHLEIVLALEHGVELLRRQRRNLRRNQNMAPLGH